MRKNLSILMLALTPFIAFGQSTRKVERQASKYSAYYPKSTSKASLGKEASLANHKVHQKATVFEENFDGTGPGFDAWTKIDVDGKTPASAVNFITTGWNRIDRLGDNGNFGGPEGDYAAMSTSWYSPAGTSNDWLITPQIAIPAGTSTFKWEAKAQDPDFPDGYKLMLAPNGGNTVADFTVELYSTAGEDSDWVTRSVSTTAYAGTNVRLAFVNNSTDMFMLLVDNILLTAEPPAATGCLTADNGQYPSATYTPVCDGSIKNITTAGWASEYSKVNLTAGTAYTFGVSKAGYFITIANEAGTQTLAAGTNSVVYTPTASGIVRFYVHTDSNCGGGTTATVHTRTVKCGTPPPPPVEPVYGCDQTYSGVPDTAHNMTKNLSTGATYAVANDFFVPKNSGTYKLQTVKFDIVSVAAAGAADITSYDVKILSDNANTPGSTVLKAYDAAVPTNVETLPDTFATYPTSRVTIDLANFELPVNTASDTKYWVAITCTSASQTSVYWIGSVYNEGWLTSSDYQSSDSGTTWVQGASTTNPNIHYEGQMIIDAECAIAAVSESGTKQISFHPNPVKDYLTINSKQEITNVQVYNIAGQKVNVSSKLVDGKLNMSQLAPGTYIISAILKDGKNESFKVIKK